MRPQAWLWMAAVAVSVFAGCSSEPAGPVEPEGEVARHGAHRAEALVVVDPGQLGESSVARKPSLVEQDLATELARLKDPRLLALALSEAAAERIIAELGTSGGERTETDNAAVRERTARIQAGKAKLLGATGDQAARLADLLAVRNLPRTMLISVRLDADDAQLAADLVNSVVDSYMLCRKEEKRRQTDARLGGLRQQLADAKGKLAGAEKVMVSYKQDHASDLIDERTSAQRLEVLQKARTQSELDLMALVQAAESKTEIVITPQMQEAVEKDPELVRLLASEAELMREKARLAEALGTNHMEYKAAEQRLASVRSEIDRRRATLKALLIEQKKRELTDALAAARARNQQVSAAYDEAVKRARELETVRMQCEKVTTEYETADEGVQALRRALIKAQVAADVSADEVYVLRPATVDAEP